jgi:Zn-dependent protease with chaperone function
MPRGRRSSRGRGVEGSAFSAVLPVLALVPIWLLALGLVWLVVRIWWQISFPWFAAGHLALSLLMFWKPLQSVVLMRLLGARHATPEQALRLEPAWRSVAQQLNLSPRKFRLAVLDSDELNAFACGGSLLVVTSYAIEILPRDEMMGVLAHELAHHLGFHTVSLTIRQWMSLPIFLLAQIGFFMDNVAVAATSSFARQSPVLRAVGGILGAVLRVVSWIFLSGLLVSNALANVVGQRAEFDADRRAVEMGFGRELAVALRRASESPSGIAPNPSRFANSHPSARTRMRRIEALRRSSR